MVVKGLTESQIGKVSSDAHHGEELMVITVQTITRSPSRDIHFDKIVLSQPNVQPIKVSVSVEKLTEEIGRSGLLQSPSEGPLLDVDGIEAGQYEPPAGYRRLQALSLRAKQ